MLDFSVIESQTLRKLVSESKKFAALPIEKQHDLLEKMSNLSYEKRQELISYFTKQNMQELSPEERIAMLENMFHQLTDLEKRFQSLMRKQPEIKARKAEAQELDSILDELGLN